MISGRQALQQIQTALKQEQQRLRELDSRLSQTNDRLLELDGRRASEMQHLAQLRLQFLATDKAPAAKPGLDDAAVLALLQARDAAYRAVQQRLSELEGQGRQLEARAAALADQRQTLTDKIGAAELEAQKQLEASPAYQQQLQATRAAERVATQAAAKATQSEEELASKGAAYDGDALFTYLWQRQYGTAGYRPGGGPFGPLLRWLDGKVARLIGFDGARANYQRLQELPVRLREHADRVQAQAQQQFEELRRLDEQGRQQGGVGALEEELRATEAQQAELQRSTEQHAQRNQAALADLEAFAQGSDENYRKAVALLRSELEAAPLQMLRNQALATPSPDDDVIVARLRDQTRERERMAQSAAEMKDSASQHRARLGQLEKLSTDFTRVGMDAPSSGFRDASVINGGLTQFLTGLLTAEALWRLLNQQRTTVNTPSNPDFGSGGFGRGTVWGGGAQYPRQQGSGPFGGAGPDMAGDIIGGILGGLLSGGSSGRSSSSRSGSSSSRGSSGSARPSGGSRTSSGGSSKGARSTGGRGKFKTGGRF